MITQNLLLEILYKNFMEYKKITKGKFPTQYEKDDYSKFFKKIQKLKNKKIEFIQKINL